jgi:cyclopropane fatty-acyl-phospholipid synthase-like methyltransferase
MNWEDYWTRYPKQFGQTEYCRQVKNTVGGNPVPESALRESISAIYSRLELGPDDTLLDLCCGNGLVSNALAKNCRRVVGVDFSQTLLDIAGAAHCAGNITYVRMNALELSKLHRASAETVTRIVMVSGLQYFKVGELPELLRNAVAVLSDSGIILLTAVPDRKCKWRFYSTMRRRLRHVWERITDRDQMGTWWDMATIEAICRRHDLDCRFFRSAGDVGHYRFDVKIARKGVLV